MSVAIKLARDMTKRARDMPSPLQLRAGDIYYIRGSIRRPGDRGEHEHADATYADWFLWGSTEVDLTPIFYGADVAEVFLWPDRCDRCKDLPAACPRCQELFQGQIDKFAGAVWPVWVIPDHRPVAPKAAYRHGPMVFLYEGGRRCMVGELTAMIGPTAYLRPQLSDWIDEETELYRQFLPDGHLHPVARRAFIAG